ncbi:uncharacterized protein LOC62_04G005462 [Vanrija pseudolonga]|uniref:Uncharacterized protein n=1 Tax=Vanrija pseudolonga TaxID=143232 RepID=A0AAF0Y8B5_9TREE|nr:hypothetical protein LOC62_04G005462 [Vanrija pseudolonga]
MSVVNGLRLVDLEISHVFTHTESGDSRYTDHAVLHRLSNPNVRRLRTKRRMHRGLVQCLNNNALRGLQTIVMTEADGRQAPQLRDASTWIYCSPSLLSICIGRCTGEPGRRCTCWDEWDRYEFDLRLKRTQKVSFEYGCFKRFWETSAAHRKTTKRTQVAAMNFLALADSSLLPLELWAMVGDFLDDLDALQSKRARELVSVAGVAERTRAMRGLEGVEFVDALEDWLAAEGFSYHPGSIDADDTDSEDGDEGADT